MTIQDRINESLIEKRFKDGNWKESNINELASDYSFFSTYLKNMSIYGPNDSIAILKSLSEKSMYWIELFTEKHSYSIKVSPTYIGCGMSCRYNLPLEDWTRGRDLPDGKCCEDTLIRIIMAIIGTELISYK